jgi:hypothetical protein
VTQQQISRHELWTVGGGAGRFVGHWPDAFELQLEPPPTTARDAPVAVLLHGSRKPALWRTHPLDLVVSPGADVLQCMAAVVALRADPRGPCMACGRIKGSYAHGRFMAPAYISCPLTGGPGAH